MTIFTSLTGRLTCGNLGIIVFNNLSCDSSLECLLIVAKFVDTVKNFAKMVANLLMLLLILSVIHFEHLLIVFPVVRQVAERVGTYLGN